MAKKILFITPGAESFGGNIFLLNFLRWFKQNSEIPFETLYGRGGDLKGSFAELSPTHQFYFDDQNDSFARKAFAKAANHLELKRRLIKNKFRRENLGLIYSNAVTNHRMLSMFADWDIPVISHCHELESMIEITGGENFRYTADRTSRFIAVSQAVRQNLVKNHSIEPEKVNLIYGFIPVTEFSPNEIESKRTRLCEELNIPADSYIVGASGTLNWRKAPEVFIQIARAICEKSPEAPIYFVWVGGAQKGDESLFRVNYDLRKAGLENRVFFLEHTANPLEHFAAIDVFAMVSREDPFPLVCLEAASLGKPVICFQDAGGMPEFVGDDAGFSVPYMDITAFAERVLVLHSNPDLKNALGENARQKVRQFHNIDTAAPKIVELIEEIIKN